MDKLWLKRANSSSFNPPIMHIEVTSSYCSTHRSMLKILMEQKKKFNFAKVISFQTCGLRW